MTSVTFPTNLGGSGATISDDADLNTGLANGGHRTRFLPALQGTVDMASYVYQYAGKIDNAAADADRAENARAYVEAVANQYEVNILEQFKNKATLVSDFANQRFRLYDGLRVNDIADTSLWTIERSTTGTYTDATGKIRTAAIDEPRYNYKRGVPQGLLLEKPSVNLFDYDSDLSQSYWGKSNLTTDLILGASESGGDVYKIIENTSSGPFRLVATETVESDEYYTVSGKVKASGRPEIRVEFAGNGFDKGITYIDIFSGSITFNSNFDAYVEPAENGYFFFYCTKRSILNDAGSVRVYLSNGNSAGYSGDGTSGVLIEQLFFEKNRYPSSLIKTNGASSARAADFAVSDIGEIVYRKMTIFFDVFLDIDVDNSAFRYIFFNSSSQSFTGSDWLGVALQGSAISVRTSIEGTLRGVSDSGFGRSTRIKLLVSIDADSGELLFSYNGQSFTEPTSQIPQQYLKPFAVSNAAQINGTIKESWVLSGSLTAAEAETLTAI